MLIPSRILRVLVALALLQACRPAGTVVIVTSAAADGRPEPVALTPLVILPYDRDSVAQALGAAGRSRPDTTELIRLLDSLRHAYAGIGALPAERRAPAQARFDRLRQTLTPKLDSLRLVQQAWRAEVYGGYDTLTLALTHRLMRDPFADTTDVHGMAVIRPKMSGPWWVTVSTWDVTDPYSEWYWNVPLTGDTVRLTPANARRRTRI